VERYRLWEEETPDPGLVENVFLASHDDQGGSQLLRLDTARFRFEPTAWPEKLRRLRIRLEDRSGTPPWHRDPVPLFVLEEIPALIIPVAGPRFGIRRERMARHPLDAAVIVQLDLAYIQDVLLPELTERYFAIGGELDYEVTVFRVDDPTAIIFESNPESHFVTGDASARLLGPVRFEELRRLWLETGLGLEGARREARQRIARSPSGRRRLPFPEGDRDDLGRWELAVRHRVGSLEAAVSQARLRNFAISLGILALLAVSVAMIVLSTQRAQRLAKQQVEFVAGVTHELQTPLAVIRSAGQNLADGVVDASGQVKEYGSLIEKEGRRLSGMVDQVLAFAGLQSQRRTFSLEEVPVDRVIESALADCGAAIEEAGIQVDKAVAPDLSVRADSSALRRAIQNLIDNAIKYGGESKWIGIGAKASSEGRRSEIMITVEDKGPGIPADELPHLFEPFYRGRDVQARRARGNGLGLALVQQIVEGHSGRVSVQSAAGRGTSFTIHLPAPAGHGK
jgi:signal transduction histidine kinase